MYSDVETGTFYNYFRDYDPATGRYPESDPKGLAGGSFSTYAYVGGNPLTRFDPDGLDCTSANKVTTCTYPSPGGPSFSFPTPVNFPSTVTGKNYHKYDVQVNLDGADPDCVMKAMINNPTLGDSHPATARGAANNASVFYGADDNWVISYLRKDLNSGAPIAANITLNISEFKWGYVAHAVTNGVAHTYGEGNAWVQAGPDWFENNVDDWVWGRMMQDMVKKCKCKNK